MSSCSAPRVSGSLVLALFFFFVIKTAGVVVALVDNHVNAAIPHPIGVVDPFALLMLIEHVQQVFAGDGAVDRHDGKELLEAQAIDGVLFAAHFFAKAHKDVFEQGVDVFAFANLKKLDFADTSHIGLGRQQIFVDCRGDAHFGKGILAFLFAVIDKQQLLDAVVDFLVANREHIGLIGATNSDSGTRYEPLTEEFVEPL